MSDEQPMGKEYTNPATGWTYITPEGASSSDFRYRPMGVRIQGEVWVSGTESWENFGLFKDKDDLYGEIELSRAEPKQE